MLNHRVQDRIVKLCAPGLEPVTTAKEGTSLPIMLHTLANINSLYGPYPLLAHECNPSGGIQQSTLVSLPTVLSWLHKYSERSFRVSHIPALSTTQHSLF